MADNLGVNPKRAFSSPDEGRNFPVLARVYAANSAEVEVEDTYVVWFAYVLGAWKALVSTMVPDGRYYEVTFNKEKDEVYVDIYEKVDQQIHNAPI